MAEQKKGSGGQKSLSSMQRRARSGSGDLMDVVTGQKGAGYWEPEPLILEILKISQQKFLASIPQAIAQHPASYTIWATSLVLSWLEKFQGAKKMTWKLLAMKSRKWFKKQGVDGHEKAIKAAALALL